jgi:hypothetical protein
LLSLSLIFLSSWTNETCSERFLTRVNNHKEIGNFDVLDMVLSSMFSQIKAYFQKKLLIFIFLFIQRTELSEVIKDTTNLWVRCKFSTRAFSLRYSLRLLFSCWMKRSWKNNISKKPYTEITMICNAKHHIFHFKFEGIAELSDLHFLACIKKQRHSTPTILLRHYHHDI